MYPSYLDVFNNNKLVKLADTALKMLESCAICPRRCRVNRLKGELGYCKTGLKPKVYSFIAHHGEEPPVSGERGSGTIFFSYCNMSCAYCQNYEFSQLGTGKEIEIEELADIIFKLQEMGCHNINFVTPTHIMPQILKALSYAIPKGLKIPLVYNTSGYELEGMIELLDGIIDIYLPDMRYADADIARKYSDAPDYPEYNKKAVKQMYRQVGVAQIDDQGIIRRGLLIRHLVLPENIAGTEKIMKFIATKISRETYVSLMSQYFPCHKAGNFQEISRRITSEEYMAAKKILERFGLFNGWIQESGGLQRFAGVNIKQGL